MKLDHPAFITTVKELCRTCYSCVRECPAKAIRIAGGQAEIIAERCISCGNCVRVCSQQAKEVKNSITDVKILLKSSFKVAACLAPSFPAEFSDYETPQLVAFLRAIGFALVTEVAFGADLIASRYAKLLQENPGKNYISSPCPAVVSYIQKYMPSLVPYLTPLVSPMVAMARTIKHYYGTETKVVFIGPCIAKKKEALKHKEDLAAVLTFTELRSMLQDAGINSHPITHQEFDPPYPIGGHLFPISRGLIRTANLSENFMNNNFISADGSKGFTDFLKEFENGGLNISLLDVLCCSGCIMGPGMSSPDLRFKRQTRITHYAQTRYLELQAQGKTTNLDNFLLLDLSASFSVDNQLVPVPSKEEIKSILQRMEKFSLKDELNCGACGYDSCTEHAIAIHSGLAEHEMCLPYTIEKLKKTTTELSQQTHKLLDTQNALIQSEKLASMGQLAAGIAHELNNPLGIVLLYAHILIEQCVPESTIYKDAKMILEQTERCKKIVSGLLNFSHNNKISLKWTDIYQFLTDSLKNLLIPEKVTFQIVSTTSHNQANIDPDLFLQVITNLVTNALEAMPEGGRLDLFITNDENNLLIHIKDTGIGIRAENLKRLFEPFFTTKQIGKGTGLGLAISYSIIKMHKGQLTVESNADQAKGPTGSTFIVKLPRHHLRGAIEKITGEEVINA